MPMLKFISEMCEPLVLVMWSTKQILFGCFFSQRNTVQIKGVFTSSESEIVLTSIRYYCNTFNYMVFHDKQIVHIL